MSDEESEPAAPPEAKPAATFDWERPGPAPTGPPDRFLFASVDELGDAARTLVAREHPAWRRDRRSVTMGLAQWLDQFHGSSWSDKWTASGVEALGLNWWTPTGLRIHHGCRAVISLMALRAVRPSYDWIAVSRLKALSRKFQEVNDLDAFAHFHAAADSDRIHPDARSAAILTLVRMMVLTGKSMEAIDKDDVLTYVAAMRKLNRPPSAHVTWQLLRAIGLLAGEAPSLREAMSAGRPSVEEMVDRYEVACRPVRDLFVDYLSHRAPALDHVSLHHVCYQVVGLFWADLETHHPGVSSFAIAPEVGAAWKRRLRARMAPEVYLGNLQALRSFYLDIAEWSLQDPKRWGRWAAPCPVQAYELKGRRKAILGVTARMHARTRSLAPLLPELTRSARQWMNETEELLCAARSAEIGGDEFTANGNPYRRLGFKGHTSKALGAGPKIRAEELFGERRVLDVGWIEDDAFWTWAVIELLRLTGIRCEELLELTHLGLRQYVRRDGEVTPLLQISPSKTDRERVIPMSPELVHVLARILRRIKGPDGRVPLVQRYDHYERVYSEPMPYLFQRPLGSRRVVQGSWMVLKLLKRGAERAGLAEVDGVPIRFTVHDFRRIFATEIVNGGLPIHIGAKLLGHLDLNTTQRYVAIYPEEVIRHFDAFLARRRSERPGDEYREPTAAECQEFEEHFALRKVALGDCGRPYGTPCVHEHACVRCPFLRVGPGQLPRLDELATNTSERIREAEDRGWPGEVAGLSESLIHITRKKDQALQLLGVEQLSLA